MTNSWGALPSQALLVGAAGELTALGGPASGAPAWTWGDLGRGYVLGCAAHPEDVDLVWQCS